MYRSVDKLHFSCSVTSQASTKVLGI